MRLKKVIDNSGKTSDHKTKEFKCLEGSRIKDYIGPKCALICTDMPQDPRSTASTSTNGHNEHLTKIGKNEHSSESLNSNFSELKMRPGATMKPISCEPEILQKSTHNEEMRISLKLEKFRKAVQDFHIKIYRDIVGGGIHSSFDSSDDSIDEKIIKMKAEMNANRPQSNNFYKPITLEPENPKLSTVENETRDGESNFKAQHQACMSEHLQQDYFNIAIKDTVEIDSNASTDSGELISEDSPDLDDLMAKIITFHAKNNARQHNANNELNSSVAEFSRVCIMQSTCLQYFDSSACITVVDESKILDDIKMNEPAANDDLPPLSTYEEFEAQLLSRVNQSRVLTSAKIHKTL